MFPEACLDTGVVPLAGTVRLTDADTVIVWNASEPTGASSDARMLEGAVTSAVFGYTVMVAPWKKVEASMPRSRHTTTAAAPQSQSERRGRSWKDSSSCQE